MVSGLGALALFNFPPPLLLLLRYDAMRVFSGVMVAVWPVGVPFVFTILLFTNRDKLHNPPIARTHSPATAAADARSKLPSLGAALSAREATLGEASSGPGGGFDGLGHSAAEVAALSLSLDMRESDAQPSDGLGSSEARLSEAQFSEDDAPEQALRGRKR